MFGAQRVALSYTKVPQGSSGSKLTLLIAPFLGQARCLNSFFNDFIFLLLFGFLNIFLLNILKLPSILFSGNTPNLTIVLYGGANTYTVQTC